MKRRPAAALALLLGAALCGPTGARAQVDAAIQSALCPDPGEVTQLHLYGLWQAQFDGWSGTATLRLEKSPNHPDGVSGEIERAGERALVAGDVDEGDFSLEESSDGRTIAATWIGKVSDNSCGKEIRGTWTRARDQVTSPFVLRKQPGWR